MQDALALVLAYLIGSIPTGYILTRWIAGHDLRQIGSGGTGATNAQRALGTKWGVAVAVADLLKGVVAVVVARLLDVDDLTIALAGAISVAAHCWPVWLGFKGGKGVATGGGAAIALTPWSLVLFPILAVPVAATRYVSLGSLTAAVAGPVLFALLAWLDVIPTAYIIYPVIAAAIIVFKHRSNIERLRSGTERRLGRSGTTGAAKAT
jgi:acyl phosphate:glycerol-3-phosphate acyltransferase